MRPNAELVAASLRERGADRRIVAPPAAAGRPIGGDVPVGRPTSIRTLVDTWPDDHDMVPAAAEAPRTAFPASCEEPLRGTGGIPAEVED